MMMSSGRQQQWKGELQRAGHLNISTNGVAEAPPSFKFK
jgi:hypothetical protein